MRRARSPTSCEQADRAGGRPPPTPSWSRTSRSRPRCAWAQVDTVKHAREQHMALRVFVGKSVGGRLHLGSLPRVAWTRLVDEAVALARVTSPTSCRRPARRRRSSPPTCRDLDLARPARPRPRRPRRRSSWPGAARRPRSRPIRASPTPRAATSATAARATPTPPAHGFAGELRDSSFSLVGVAGGRRERRRCSATTGTTSTRQRARLEATGGDRPHRRAARAAPPGRPPGEDRRGAGGLRPRHGGQPGAAHRGRGRRAPPLSPRVVPGGQARRAHRGARR